MQRDSRIQKDFSLKTCLWKLGYGEVGTANTLDQSNSRNNEQISSYSTDRSHQAPQQRSKVPPARPPLPQIAPKPTPTIIRPVKASSSNASLSSSAKLTRSVSTNAINQKSNSENPRPSAAVRPPKAAHQLPNSKIGPEQNRPVVPLKPNNLRPTSANRYANFDERPLNGNNSLKGLVANGSNSRNTALWVDQQVKHQTETRTQFHANPNQTSHRNSLENFNFQGASVNQPSSTDRYENVQEDEPCTDRYENIEHDRPIRTVQPSDPFNQWNTNSHPVTIKSSNVGMYKNQTSTNQPQLRHSYQQPGVQDKNIEHDKPIRTVQPSDPFNQWNTNSDPVTIKSNTGMGQNQTSINQPQLRHPHQQPGVQTPAQASPYRPLTVDKQKPPSVGSVVKEFKAGLSLLSKEFREATTSTPKPGVVYSQPSLTSPFPQSTPPANVTPTPNYSVNRSTSESEGSCLECRDFVQVDTHAGNFPRQTVTSLANLAYDLCSPFPSRTDKARAIFVWLHHNIAYDYVAFFSNSVKRQSPEQTLRSGLAVCQGYAELFASLARLSNLEAIVVSGHGKGVGYTQNTTGRVPSLSTNHAWNAVQVDSGLWQLIDCCWGAGYLNNQNVYVKHLNTAHFTSSPETFGLTHFPTSPQYQFSSFNMSWEEYIMMKDGPLLYANFHDLGLSKLTIQPRTKAISPKPNTKFLITTRCQHKGIAPRDQSVLLLSVDGAMTPFQVNSGGTMWTCETWSIKTGSQVSVCVLTQFKGKPATGVSVQEYLDSKGMAAMSFSYLCKWDVL